jgi:hypothetical protein
MPSKPAAIFGDTRASSPRLSSCAPVQGPRRRPVAPVPVDAELMWVMPVPVVALGVARPSSPVALVHLHVQLARESAAVTGDVAAALDDAGLIDAAARVVAGYLEDLPDLPLVGEPFGGEEGTD